MTELFGHYADGAANHTPARRKAKPGRTDIDPGLDHATGAYDGPGAPAPAPKGKPRHRTDIDPGLDHATGAYDGPAAKPPTKAPTPPKAKHEWIRAYLRSCESPAEGKTKLNITFGVHPKEHQRVEMVPGMVVTSTSKIFNFTIDSIEGRSGTGTIPAERHPDISDTESLQVWVRNEDAV